MLRRMRGRLVRQNSHRDLRTSEIVRYQGVSVASVARLLADIENGKAAPDVELFVLTSEDIHGTDRVSGESVSLKGRTVRVESPSASMSGVVAYIDGRVTFSEADAVPKPRTEWTIEDVCEHVVLPAADERDDCFWLDIIPEKDVGRQYKGAFVSQARQCSFGDLTRAILAHYSGKDLTKQFVWLDIFSANQPRLTGADNESPLRLAQRYDLLTGHLHDAIDRFDERLIFFDSWLEPRALTRMWCVWEIYGSVRRNKSMDLIFAPGQDAEFVRQVRQNPHAITGALARFEMRDANCHSESDRAMITEAVEALPGGFAALNGSVLDKLRPWLALTAKQVLKRQMDEEGASELEAARLAHCVGQLASLLGDTAGAERMFEQALEVKRRILGDSHSDVVTTMHEVASILDARGKFTEAKALFEECLRIREGQEYDDPEQGELTRAVTLHSLAQVMQTMGDLAGARARFEEVLEIKKRVQGPTHEQTGVTMHQLAAVMRSQGETGPALDMFREALAIKEHTQSPKHPSVVSTKYAIAQSLQALGDTDEALALFYEVLAAYKEQLGADHVNTATAMHEIANILLAKGDAAGAVELYKQALAIKQLRLGENHPRVADTMHALAMAIKTEDSAEALRLLLDAAAIKASTLGRKHRQVAVTLHEAGVVCKERGELDKALKLLLKAVAIKQGSSGKDSGDTAATMHQTGLVLMKMGKTKRASAMLLSALEVERRARGPKALQVAYTAHEAAMALGSIPGSAEQALALMTEAFEIKLANLGPEHIQTAVTQYELAVMLVVQGEREQALEMFTHVRKVFAEKLGEESGSVQAADARINELEQ